MLANPRSSGRLGRAVVMDLELEIEPGAAELIRYV